MKKGQERQVADVMLLYRPLPEDYVFAPSTGAVLPWVGYIQAVGFSDDKTLGLLQDRYTAVETYRPLKIEPGSQFKGKARRVYDVKVTVSCSATGAIAAIFEVGAVDTRLRERRIVCHARGTTSTITQYYSDFLRHKAPATKKSKKFAAIAVAIHTRPSGVVEC